MGVQRLRAGSVEVEGVGAGRSGSGCHIACPLSPLSVVLPCHPSTERFSDSPADPFEPLDHLQTGIRL